MPTVLDNPATLRAVIYLLALGYLVAVAFVAFYRSDARYWRQMACVWRAKANDWRRRSGHAVAFRHPSRRPQDYSA